ncbi:MAG: xanthine dehydrogenase family protein molybdopterin-binding subunit, partial [Gammaproteobacteria bacterium]
MNKPEKPAYQFIGTSPIRPDGIDKVTGRAQYGADLSVPGMVWGDVLRSPHAHARIKSIDYELALSMEGVLAVVTADDFVDLRGASVAGGESPIEFVDLSHNVMARGKVLYNGHAVAAVAAVTREIAAAAVEKIVVDYEVLEPVLDIAAAKAPDAPLLDENLITHGYDTPPEQPSNIAQRHFFKLGDVAAGFAEAEEILERTYYSPTAHQGYIEPHACVAEADRTGKVNIWCCTQGQFVVRSMTAALLGTDVANVKVTPSEIGGGFGGKTTVYLEPLAAALSMKAQRAVKMVMRREDVFRATGPTSASLVRVKVGARRDGTITAMDATLEYEAGAFKGSPVMPGCWTAFAAYRCPNQRVEGFDILVNKAKVAAYRAPGAPQSALAVECVLNELSEKLGMDPIELRLKNIVEIGDKALYGATFEANGLRECLERARDHDHYQSALGEDEGRGVAVGYWFNVGLSSSAVVHLTESGRVIVQEGNPDIGGSRASMALMTAETLGIPYEHVTVHVTDTEGVGYNDVTGGSRTTFATGLVVVESARDIVRQLCERAAMIWKIDVEQVEWEQGQARNREDSSQVLSITELAKQTDKTGGPITGRCSKSVEGAAGAFSVNMADVRVDRGTGRVDVTRFTAIQDAGTAIHPAFVEGQMQGGAVQGIGWALNETYYFDDEGVMANQSFLDYRMPVALDVPMIDTVIVEVPN